MAEVSFPLTGAILGYYGGLVESAIKRWQQASADVRQRQYTATNLISDVVATWFDVAAACYPPLPFNAVEPLARLVISSAQRKATAVVPIPHHAPDNLQLQIPTGPGGIHLPNTTNAGCILAQSGDFIVVNVDASAGNMPQQGVYDTRVLDSQGKELVEVRIEVQP